MKQSTTNHNDTDDDEADDTLRSIGTSSDSYDTTEDLTDTDNSSQNKLNPSRRKNNSDDDRKPVSKSLSMGSSKDGSFGGRVKFVLKATQIHKVESHENFSSKERSNYWWSDREKDRMMAKHERLVAKYEQQRSSTKSGSSKKFSEEKLGSYRGLESWTAAGSLKLDHTIEQCISAVMDEQDRQWAENDDDADVIAQKSKLVTADSARRARLNGLQDAQEALKIRGETWANKGGSDEISVGSSVSTGTAAIAKKKRRSKLLATLDDSHKALKGKKKKKKKKKKTKDEEGRKKKSKDKRSTSSLSKSENVQTADQDTTLSTQPLTVASRSDEHEKSAEDDFASIETNSTPANPTSFSAGSTVPVSPLSTQTALNATSNEKPSILDLLRSQQEQLQQSSTQDTKSFVHHLREASVPEVEDDEDSSPLLQTLRAQQKSLARTWQDDPSDGGNSRSPPHSGSSASKVSSFRVDNSKAGDNETGDSSDPPGRRPRRLASRHVGSNRGHFGASHVIPESSDVEEEEILRDSSGSNKARRSRSRSHDRSRFRRGESSKTPLDPDLSATDGSKADASFPNSPGGTPKKSLNPFRNGAKTLFKKGSKR